MVPIAFTPLSWGDWIRGRPDNFQEDWTREELSHRVRRAYGCARVFWVSSGNTALALLLGALSKETGKRQVILPAYTHGSIALLIRDLGLEAVLVDTSASTFTQSHHRLKELCTAETLCLVVSHVFGLPAYTVPEQAMLKSLPCSVIEDCTQAVGSRLNFRYVGGIGRAAWISFGHGENVSVSGGGAILTNDEPLARLLEKSMERLAPVSRRQEWKTWLVMGGARVATARAVYGAVWRLMRRRRTARIAERYPTHQFGGVRLLMAKRLWNAVETWSAQRFRNGLWLKGELSLCKGVTVPEFGQESEPAFNRFPILVRHRGLRDQVQEALSRSGIEVAHHYAEPVHRALPMGYSKEKEPFPQASYMAERLLVLPVHPGVRQRDLAKMVEVIQRICG